MTTFQVDPRSGRCICGRYTQPLVIVTDGADTDGADALCVPCALRRAFEVSALGEAASFATEPVTRTTRADAAKAAGGAP